MNICSRWREGWRKFDTSLSSLPWRNRWYKTRPGGIREQSKTLIGPPALFSRPATIKVKLVNDR